MKKVLLSVFAAALSLGASASATWQLGPYAYTADTLFHSTTGPGITTTGIRLSSANGSNKSNIFYSTIDLTNPNIELRGVQAKDNGDVTESVLAMGNRKNGQGNGQYVAGVNADFFNMGGKPIRTNGHSLVDGTLYNGANGGDGWNTWASYATVNGAKDIFIDTGVKASKIVKFPDGNTHSFFVNPNDRWDDYLCIYTPAKGTSTGTNVWGRECQMKLVSGSLEANDAVFEITSPWVGDCSNNPAHGNMEIPADGFVLSGINGSGGNAYTLMGQLKVGDRISLGTTVTYQGRAIEPKQSVGGCSMIVMDGKIAPDSYFSSSIVDHFVSNQARTVIGYNKDRTKLIIMVCDKYSSYAKEKDDDGNVIGLKVKDEEKLSFGSSTGMVLQRMGHIMLELGCYTAMNFDGGGSSQLYNKELGIRNVPYGDTYYRPVANGFFAVETTPVDNTVAMLEVYQKNVKLAAGETFTPKVFGYNKYGVLIDKDVKGFTFTVAPALGATEGTTFTAGDAKGSTHGVVAKGDMKCAVRILTNGGGDYTTSGDDEAPLEIKAPYIPDEPMGIDKDPLFLTEQWSFVNHDYNDGWDKTDPDWTSEDAIKSKPCPRFATARNGRFYTVDMRSMSIAEIDNEGNLTPLYKLPSLEGRVFNGVPDYYGCAISSDDYGNFLIGHLFTKTDTYRVWTVYCPKTGKAKHFEFPLPTGSNANGRIDNIGRVVGNLTQEAYAYVAPVATGVLENNLVNILHFKGDGKGNLEALTAENTYSKGIYMAGGGNTLSTCQPKYATVAEMAGKDLNETFYWYSKAGGLGQSNQDLFTYENGTFSKNYCNDWNNFSRLNGFDTFILGGKRYFVVHYSADASNNSGHGILVKDESGTTIAEWNNPKYQAKDAGFNTITAVPVDANNVNIYVYNCTGSEILAGKDPDGKNIGAIAGALLRLSLGEYTPYEPEDISAEGYNFDNYEEGEPLKLTATETSFTYSAPAGLYHTHYDKAQADKHLTVYLDRNCDAQFNTQEYVDKEVSPAYVVRTMDKVGKVLAVTQPYAPGFNRYGWASKGTGGKQAQLNFYVPAEKIRTDREKRHYVRVRLVYNVMLRGCHYTTDLKNGTVTKLVPGIYATHENNWVVPGEDAETGNLYAETGINFAQWVNETDNIANEVVDNPEVFVPAENGVDVWDAHNDNHNGNAPAYLMNPQRYRVYEFDTYIDNPSAATVSVQFNMTNRNTGFFIKEIKFTDLGTDEAAATLLGRRQIGWQYFNENTVGIEDINVDNVEEADAPAVYYNLQGVQVVNPESGIYIVRRGNKVTKEYIR